MDLCIKVDPGFLAEDDKPLFAAFGLKRVEARVEPAFLNA
jgi:hypothetical protein